MARGKVAEWIRKRTMPRKTSSSRRRSSTPSAASEEPILREAAPESWSSSASRSLERTPTKAAASGPPPTASKVRSTALPAMLRWRPRVNVVAVLYGKVVYHLMWLVESVVVVGRLVFFLMRFGFKQL
ncbi:uncharacterized protein LOC124660008 [Lolium rigidum]|uniref:uncharacterized protein LOC124660008 n=1 Tax=Lolium rigidum TaxID=89674 RepID=UPI001F5E0265|nr:uncharacterized protein LOC124660008 [Lolium rigidum]